MFMFFCNALIVQSLNHNFSKEPYILVFDDNCYMETGSLVVSKVSGKEITIDIMVRNGDFEGELNFLSYGLNITVSLLCFASV